MDHTITTAGAWDLPLRPRQLDKCLSWVGHSLSQSGFQQRNSATTVRVKIAMIVFWLKCGRQGYRITRVVAHLTLAIVLQVTGAIYDFCL